MHSPERGLLLLAYWYPPENESGALRPARFCKYLPRYGYKPSVIAAPLLSASDTHGMPGVERTPDARSVNNRSRLRSLIGRIAQRIAPYNDRLEWLPHAIAAGSATLARSRIEVLVSTSPPVATHLAAMTLARRHKLPWVADFRDPILGNPFRTRPFGRRYDRIVERAIVTRASAVVVNTDAALHAFTERYAQLRHKFHLVWNGYDPEDGLRASPVPPRSYRLIAHLGSVYGARHPGVLLDCLHRLAQRSVIDPGSFRIRLVGSLERDAPWFNSASSESLRAQGSLECTNQILPREQAQQEMAEADYLLLLDLNETGIGIQVPAKLFEYVRIGRPVLTFTTRGSPVERILGQSDVPHVCIYVDELETQVDNKVLSFLSLSTQPVTASAWFREQFDAIAQTATLASILSEATRGAGCSSGCAVPDQTVRHGA